MEKVNLDQKDIGALAEFIVLTIEAERKDRLERVEFDLDLGAPELWVIPFIDKGGSLHLGIRK